MLIMIIKMSLLVLGHVILTVFLWQMFREKKITVLVCPEDAIVAGKKRINRTCKM